jgi:hypothetical protein
VDGTPGPDDQTCLTIIAEALKTARTDTADLVHIMNEFFRRPE